MNRKASLNLSIQTIVIVVLAMTLLGLGLGFVRNQIGQISETGTTVQQQVQEQITEQLRQSGDKISFPREVTMKKGSRETLSLGVQNTGSTTLNFKLIMEWDLANSDFSDQLEQDPNFFELRWDQSCQELSPSDAIVSGINSRPPNSGGTYALKAVVKDYPTLEDCEADATGEAGITYATKLAFISVG